MTTGRLCVLLILLLSSPSLVAADDDQDRKFTNKFVGTLCPDLAEEIIADGGRARKGMEKQSFTSPDITHCFLRASRSQFIDDSIFKGRAPMDQLRVRTLGGVNSFLDRKCSEVSGRFVWGPSYLAKNGSQLQWRGCVAGSTYRFLASVERAPVEEWPIYYVRIVEPTDLSRAPSPKFAAYLKGRGFVAPDDLTSADWARTAVEEERRLAGQASAAERIAQDRDRAREAEKRRLAPPRSEDPCRRESLS